MIHLSYIRQRYGEGYVTVLPDGLQIPWRPLSVGDYLSYQQLIENKTYPIGYIHNEIFKKCVLDKHAVNNLDKTKAGIITAVATSILEHSGPRSMDELDGLLNYGRHKAQHILNQIVVNICWAFPAYSPDDIYKMDYYTLLDRLALAEFKLAKMGLISDMLSFRDPNKEENPEVPKKKPTEDLLKKYYEQEGIKVSEKKPVAPRSASSNSQTIITAADIKEVEAVYTGHELQDQALLEHQMVEQTAWIYKDYLDQLQKDGKITMKSDEQRKEEALERARINEKKAQQLAAARSAKEKKAIEDAKKSNISKREFKKSKKRRR